MNQFSFYRPPVTNTVPYRSVTLTDVAKYISSNHAAEATATLRRMISEGASPGAIRAYKASHFCYCTFSGVFPPAKRRADSLVEHSGLICLDIDDLPESDVEPVFSTICADPLLSPLMVFRSPSGRGIKVVVEVFLREHSHIEWFFALENYFYTSYGVRIDRACKDVSRACFLPADPKMYINF